MKKRNSDAQKIAQSKPEVVKKKRASSIVAQNRPETKRKKSGKNNYRYDATLYVFTHIDGRIEIMPANDFSVKYEVDRGWLSNVIRGVRKSIKGWRVVILLSVLIQPVWLPD